MPDCVTVHWKVVVATDTVPQLHPGTSAKGKESLLISGAHCVAPELKTHNLNVCGPGDASVVGLIISELQVDELVPLPWAWCGIVPSTAKAESFNSNRPPSVRPQIMKYPQNCFIFHLLLVSIEFTAA